VARPDPIPNSAVKHSLADGSACIACARVGCRQIFLKSRNAKSFRLFYCRNEVHLNIRQGLEELDRGEGIPGKQVEAELKAMSKAYRVQKGK
jgi:hypothetical protein